MGTWGIRATQCDSALDWLEAVWQRTGLVAELAKGLTADVHEHPDQIRIAAYFVERLGQAGLLLDHQSDILATEASSQLKRIVDEGVVTNPAMVGDIRSQMRSLDNIRRGRSEAGIRRF